MSTPFLIANPNCAIDATELGVPRPPTQWELTFTGPSAYPCRVRFRDDPKRHRSPLIELSGDLDTHTSTRMEPTIDEVLAGEPAAIDIDASRVTFIDGRGIRLLLRIQRHLAIAGAEMRLVSPAPCVRRLVQLLDLGDTFEIVTKGALKAAS